MWKIITEFIKQRGLQNQTQPSNEEEKTKYENLINDNRNFYLKGVTFNIHHSQQISVGISKMQGLTNSIRVTQEGYSSKILTLIKDSCVKLIEFIAILSFISKNPTAFLVVHYYLDSLHCSLDGKIIEQICHQEINSVHMYQVARLLQVQLI